MVRIGAVVVFGLVALLGCQSQNDQQASPDPGEQVAQTEPLETSAIEADSMDRPDEQHRNLEQLSAGNREFALAAFQRLLNSDDADDNLLVSPHSILSALAMVYAGAEGATREQMRQTLRFQLNEPALHQAFQALDEALADRARVPRDDDASGFELNIVNRLWAHDTYDFVQAYLDQVQTHYGAGIERVDFENDYRGARLAINDWVAEQTRDRIEDLLPDGVLNEDTRLVLVNAIYFLASWQDAFEAELTRDQAFRPLNGQPVDVPMMQRTARFPAYLGEDSVAVAIPYLGGQVSLLAMMPADDDADFGRWQAGLDAQAFDAIVAGLDERQVALDFPRFSAEGGFQLADLLQSMGMTDAFSRIEANFERMTGVGPGVMGRSLYIDEVFHQTFIELDEAGTEAAAATAVVMMRLTAMPVEEDPVTIRFDRPFVYAIYDHPTGSILFLGRQGAISP
ncbi:MAG: serpin family protein [Wenzhouxiangella sp.]